MKLYVNSLTRLRSRSLVVVDEAKEDFHLHDTHIEWLGQEWCDPCSRSPPPPAAYTKINVKIHHSLSIFSKESFYLKVCFAWLTRICCGTFVIEMILDELIGFYMVVNVGYSIGWGFQLIKIIH